MAEATGLSRATVHRIWAKTGRKPHRLGCYMASTDPQFEEKAADIIGLYLNPPQHAAVFCVDERMAIRARDRLHPVSSLSPGRAEPHGFECYGHSAISLYAALDVKTNEIHEDFIAFVSEVLERSPAPREIHIVLDNLSTHKTQAVKDFLTANPNGNTAYVCDDNEISVVDVTNPASPHLTGVVPPESDESDSELSQHSLRDSRQFAFSLRRPNQYQSRNGSFLSSVQPCQSHGSPAYRFHFHSTIGAVL
jgi:hypothetical protein